MNNTNALVQRKGMWFNDGCPWQCHPAQLIIAFIFDYDLLSQSSIGIFNMFTHWR